MSAPEFPNAFPDDPNDNSPPDSVEEFPTFTYSSPSLSAGHPAGALNPGSLQPEEHQTQLYIPALSGEQNPTPSLIPVLPSEDWVDITSAPESYDPQWNSQGVRSPGQIPGYRILGYIGQGGSSTVFRGLHLQLGIDVAIKIQHFQYLNSDLQRETAEVGQRLGGLRHPNLVAMYGAGTHNRNPFLVMELIDGVPLSQFSQMEPRVGPTVLVRIMEQVTRAAAYLHRQGILHRDIKPGNILVDSHRRARLADYGLATRWPTPFGRADGQIVGTPAYMAPEQVTALSSDFGPALDIWAIGASLFWLLSNVNPFRRDSIQATLQAVVNDSPPSLRELWPDAPEALDRICSRCLRRNPEDRYLCADDLANDLLAFLDGEGNVA